jgi:hypothetical protein
MVHSGRLALLGSLAMVVVATAAMASGQRSRPQPVQAVEIDCRVSASNDGCETVVRCPAGTTVVRAKAACNLEYGAVTDAQLAGVPGSSLMVVVPSDHVEEGSCWVHQTRVNDGHERIEGVARLTQVSAGCQEHDKNGGDCHIRGTLLCR